MAGGARTRADDIAVLRLLDIIDDPDLTAVQIRERTGFSNGAVQGYRLRFLKNAAPCLCQKPENRDGGLKRGWWRG